MDSLETLAKLQKELKAKTIDRKLTQLNFMIELQNYFNRLQIQ